MKFLIYVMFLLMGTCHCQQYKTCPEIEAKYYPTIKELVDISPLVFYWGTESEFKCAQRTFSYPDFGDKTYVGNFYNANSTDIQTYKIKQNPDGQSSTIYKFTDNSQMRARKPFIGMAKNNVLRKIEDTRLSSPQSSFQLKIVAFKSDQNGAYVCGASCDGIKLRLFYCYSNSDNYMQEMLDMVEKVKFVPSAKEIYYMRKDCPISEECPFLNAKLSEEE